MNILRKSALKKWVGVILYYAPRFLGAYKV